MFVAKCDFIFQEFLTRLCEVRVKSGPKRPVCDRIECALAMAMAMAAHVKIECTYYTHVHERTS